MPTVVRALLLSLVALAIAAPAASAAVPTGFVGLSADDLYGNGGPYRDKALDQQKTAGVKLLRGAFNWAAIEIAPNNFDFATYDKYVLDAAQRGITMLPVLFNTPDFHSTKPAGSNSRFTFPPRDNATFANFARRVASRYGPTGTLWASNPGVTRLPFVAYQIWNEPTLKQYWQPRPKPADYAALLTAGSAAIKAVDPAAEIVTAGLPDSRLKGAIRLEPYLKAMYKAAGSDAFDTVAINTYAVNARYMGKLMDRTRKTLNRIGGRSDKMWITEVGWCDKLKKKRAKHRFCLGSKGQAKNIGAALKLMKKKRKAWKLRGFVLFSWRDGLPYAGTKDQWGLHTGLLNVKGKKKPSYKAFVKGVKAFR